MGASRDFVLGLLAIAFVLAFMFRFEGTSTGGAVPRLVPRWVAAHEAPESVAKPKVEAASQGSTTKLATPEGLVDFPGYLGPHRTGEIEGNLNPDWTNSPPVELWRKPVGLGWGAFSVVGPRAVTMEQRGDEEFTTCCQVATGELLWAESDGGRFSEAMGGDGPRSTPTILDGAVYTVGALGALNCRDLVTGELRWTANVLKAAESAKNLEWATTSSPLVYDGRVYAFGGRDNAAGRLLAFDAEAGSFLWASGEGDASYASPSLGVVDGVSQILSTNPRGLSGHDPVTGIELWNHRWVGAMPIKAAQIQVLDNGDLFCGAGYNLGSIRLTVKRGSEGAWVATEKWVSDKMKTKFSNASIRGDYAWGLDEGRFVCQDLTTGERLWKETRYGYGQQLLVGDHFLIQAERGYLALVEARHDKFVERSRVEALDSKTWNPPCLAGEYLLVRNDREAICFRVPVLSAGN